jgi:hypothetical protein
MTRIVLTIIQVHEHITAVDRFPDKDSGGDWHRCKLNRIGMQQTQDAAAFRLSST